MMRRRRGRADPDRAQGDQSPSPLTGVRTFAVPKRLVLATLDVLAEAGREENEAFVLWGGVATGAAFEYRTMLVPHQVAHQMSSGLLVTVEGSALFAVNKELYERGEILAAQIHSHPTDAFHSDTDDCYALVTLSGALSVVVPNFAREGLDGIDAWAWYRLEGPATWMPLRDGDRVEIVEDRT